MRNVTVPDGAVVVEIAHAVALESTVMACELADPDALDVSRGAQAASVTASVTARLAAASTAAVRGAGIEGVLWWWSGGAWADVQWSRSRG